MSANPFLFTEEDYLPQPASNPFLTDFNDEQPTTTPNTNPFAFDPDELESTQQAVHNFFDVHQSEPPAQKPTELDLKFTNTVDEVPARPPPSKETQDLFMSVMGAMDATSSHLLDRIPPTRTPSPVSVRDLHSPSPTPDAPFGDLLDVGDVRAPTVEKKQDDDLLMMGEVEVVEKAKPARPGPPVRPPKPPPPKPPPPVLSAPPKPPPPVNNHKVDDGMLDLFGVESVVKPQKTTVSKDDILNLYKAPPKPEPVKDLLFDDALETVETVPAEEPKPPIEVFEPVQPPPKPKPPQPEILKTIAQPPPQPPTPFPEEAAPFPTSSPEIQEDKLVQTPVNGNLYVDTSGSQSKGSISSMTQNPFAIDDSSQQPSLLPSPGVQSEPIVVAEKEPDVLTSYPSEPVVKEGFDDFDAFAQKFESAVKDENKNGFDAFLGTAGDTWGGDSGFNDSSSGFDNEDGFDSFLAMKEPPNKMNKAESQDSDEDKDFSVIIRPTGQQSTPFGDASVPVLAPPPVVAQSAFTDTSPRLNPFDQSDLPAATAVSAQEVAAFPGPQEFQRTDSQETPPTPLFDDDVSQPLEPFPRTICEKKEWEMQLRQPNKKKITGQRFWKKIHVKLLYQADCVLLQLYNQAGDKDPFQELPLQPCYSVSDIGTQQYDQYGKIFTVKLQYIFYKERPGVRPGQVKKAEKITNKLSQFAAYAIQGDYQGVKEFGSDLKKLGLPVEHAPQVSQLMKLGSLNYEDLKQFSVAFEEALFTLQAHRDRALHYKMEEVQVTAVDELYVEQNAEGHVEKQIARVRLFFLGFLTGMPDIELGVNDMRRQGKEVVGRHDIIPVVTEEWIRLENVEFHNCVDQEEYNKTHIIKFKPPDACYIELLRFRIRPPKNRELPLQLKATICVTGTKIELRADVLVPGFASRKLGQVPCEDVMIRFPIPECWIYMFRVEKHFRYGSVKSAHRRTGKIKGIERILGTVDALQESLIEVTSGQAKYEHQHRAIVWRCPRLPKEGQGAYTTHNMVCRLALTSFDQMPEQLAEYCYVEFTMPATQASHTTVRSVSLQNSDSDEPPEKYVRYLARHEYRVGIEHTQGEGPNAYVVATMVKPAPVPEEPAAIPEAESSSDSD